MPGISDHSASLLRLVTELARFYQVDSAQRTEVLTSLDACGAYLVPRFFGRRLETVFLLCLDAKCKVLDCSLVHRGAVNMTAISARKIVKTALDHNATSVVVAHNHPSGLALPSREDRETTATLKAALNAVGVALVDHVIVADGDFVSLADDGLL